MLDMIYAVYAAIAVAILSGTFYVGYWLGREQERQRAARRFTWRRYTQHTQRVQ